MIKIVPDPDIKIVKANCSAFASGFCFSAENPFYSGHYETLDEALEAAERDKRKRCTAVTSIADAGHAALAGQKMYDEFGGEDHVPKQEVLTLWKLLRKNGVGLYTAQMICNDAMLHGVTVPAAFAATPPGHEICSSCNRIFKFGDTCTRGGCPCGGDV